MIEAIIFDLDGLLIDSEPYWREADFQLAKEYGFPLTDDFRKQLMGRGVKENAEIFIKSFNLNETIDHFSNKRLETLYRVLFKKLRLMPYAQMLLKNLAKRKFIMALATAGHERDVAQKILKKLAIHHYFSVVVSGTEVKKSKPAPDVYLETAKRLNILPTQCVVIEDAVNGVVAGKAAGMKVIGVNKEKEMRNELENVKADKVFKNLNIPINTFRN